MFSQRQELKGGLQDWNNSYFKPEILDLHTTNFMEVMNYDMVFLYLFAFFLFLCFFFIQLNVYYFYFFSLLYRSPLSPSSVSGSQALPPPNTPGTTTGLLTTPTKKTHQRSKSDATAAITAASNRLMQVGHLH